MHTGIKFRELNASLVRMNAGFSCYHLKYFSVDVPSWCSFSSFCLIFGN